MPATVELHTQINGLTSPTVTLFAEGSDTALDAGTTATAATNRFGVYTFSTSRTGKHRIELTSGGIVRWFKSSITLAASGTIVAADDITLIDGYTAAGEAAAKAALMAAGDIDGYTLEQAAKLMLAALAGKLSGGGTTTNTIRAADDSKARITATVDAAGNRTAITLDAAG